MKTTVPSEGRFLLFVEFRQQGEIKAGQEFEIEREHAVAPLAEAC